MRLFAQVTHGMDKAMNEALNKVVNWWMKTK